MGLLSKEEGGHARQEYLLPSRVTTRGSELRLASPAFTPGEPGRLDIIATSKAAWSGEHGSESGLFLEGKDLLLVVLMVVDMSSYSMCLSNRVYV